MPHSCRRHCILFVDHHHDDRTIALFTYEFAFVRLCVINCPMLLRGQRVLLLYMRKVIDEVSEC